MSAIPHGGDLSDLPAPAAAQEPWLDLSTGINPHAWPARISTGALAALPQRGALQRLLRAARHAYRVPATAAVVAAPGTQAILQWLPEVLPVRTVAVLAPTYAEHLAVWSRTLGRAADRRPPVRPVATLEEAAGCDLAVVVNPNNPDGRLLAPARLRAFAAARPAAGGVNLLVDEAFGDLVPEQTTGGAPHTLVLRSFGKFYGLAGLRLGFAVGPPAVVARLAEALGPWAVGGPALEAGAAALEDGEWAHTMRTRLAGEREALDRVLLGAGLRIVGGTDLFRLIHTRRADLWHAALLRRAINTRRFEDAPEHLRIGLPGAALPRLAAALAAAGDEVGAAS